MIHLVWLYAEWDHVFLILEKEVFLPKGNHCNYCNYAYHKGNKVFYYPFAHHFKNIYYFIKNHCNVKRLWFIINTVTFIVCLWTLYENQTRALIKLDSEKEQFLCYLLQPQNFTQFMKHSPHLYLLFVSFLLHSCIIDIFYSYGILYAVITYPVPLEVPQHYAGFPRSNDWLNPNILSKVDQRQSWGLPHGVWLLVSEV